MDTEPLTDLHETPARKPGKMTGGKSKKIRRRYRQKAAKRPLHAFFLYHMKVCKDKLAPAGLDLGAVSKWAKETWNAMTPDQKAPFERQAQVDRERYNDELQLLPIKPKGRRNAWILFSTSESKRLLDTAAGQEESPKDRLRDLAKRWKVMSPAEKEPWARAAAADRERYQTEISHQSEEKKSLAF